MIKTITIILTTIFTLFVLNGCGSSSNMWDKTKDTASDAWDGTKQGSKSAWKKTKDAYKNATD